MIKVTMREFQRNAPDYLDKLPIILTRYDRPVAIVNVYGTMPVEEKITAAKLAIDLADVPSKTVMLNYDATNIPVASTTKENRWCELHFEKNVKYDCLLITWEDENGTAVIEKKMACPKCIAKYENMGRGHLYFL